uniref:Uncharacterized protein n=1 Tax=Aegilops tauschii TaxID=37682 RepID=M8CJ97_AEGTA
MTPEWSPEHRRLLSPPPAATSTPAPATTDAAAVSLPDDVVSDILSRLPVKSVSRLRCVCRGWRAIVSDPGFAALHRSRQAEPLIIASVYQEYPWGSRDLQLMDMDGNVVKVIKGGGSIGLLSTSMDVIVCVTDAFSYDAHVVDLATGDVLVHCPKSRPRSRGGMLTCFCGFGRAVPSGMYKVVRLWSDQTCEVLTVGEDVEWRWMESCPTKISSPLGVNGNIYFLISWQLDRDCLVCFELESEQWKEPIKGPMSTICSEPWSRRGKVCITELNGSLCVVQLVEQMTIWLMTESNEDRWIKMYTVAMAPSTYCARPLWVTRDGGKLIFYSWLHGQAPVLRAYDPCSETCSTLRELEYDVEIIRLCSLQLNPFVTRKI